MADKVYPQAPGEIVADGASEEIVTAKSDLRVWAGKVGDPFWVEPDVPHAVGHAFQDCKVVDFSGWDAKQAKNPFAGSRRFCETRD